MVLADNFNRLGWRVTVLVSNTWEGKALLLEPQGRRSRHRRLGSLPLEVWTAAIVGDANKIIETFIIYNYKGAGLCVNEFVLQRTSLQQVAGLAPCQET